MRQTEQRLCAEFFGEVLVGLPEPDHGVRHLFKIPVYATADVAVRFQFSDPLQRFVSLTAADAAVAQVFFQFGKVALQRQRHAEPILAHKHEVVVRAAEALPVGFDSDVRFHH